MNRILWTQKQDEGPSPRGRAAMAYDDGRGRTVLFGGGGFNAGEAVLGDTWEWDGANWTQMADSGPPARNLFGMAFDAQRRQTVLFGGAAGLGAFLGDTWAWDGHNWTQLADSGPPARQGLAMAFDSSAQRIVLFGGAGAGPPLADTWAWDGAAWTQVAETGPSARYVHSLAYDGNRNRTVLFGGFGGADTNTLLGDTWERDGAVWTQISSFGAQPSASGAMAFKGDSVAQFGGQTSGLNAAVAQYGATWTWDGHYWTLRQDFSPPPRLGHAMCYDSKRATLVVFGGGRPAEGITLGDTWEHSEG